VRVSLEIGEADDARSGARAAGKPNSFPLSSAPASLQSHPLCGSCPDSGIFEPRQPSRKDGSPRRAPPAKPAEANDPRRGQEVPLWTWLVSCSIYYVGPLRGTRKGGCWTAKAGRGSGSGSESFEASVVVLFRDPSPGYQMLFIAILVLGEWTPQSSHSQANTRNGSTPHSDSVSLIVFSLPFPVSLTFYQRFFVNQADNSSSRPR
jgi:hypothetical protein